MSRIGNNGQNVPVEFFKTNSKQETTQVKTDNSVQPEINLNDQKNFVSSKGTDFNQNLSFVDDNIDNPDSKLYSDNIYTLVSDLEEKSKALIKEKKGSFPASAAKDLYKKQSKLKELLNKKLKDPGDVKDLRNAYLVVVRQMNTLGLLDSSIKKDLDKVSIALLKKVGDDFDMKIEPSVVNGKLLGVVSSPKTGDKLNKTQEKVHNKAKDIFMETESIKSLREPLSPASVALMGMRQALLSRSIDIVTAQPDKEFSPEYQDLEAIANTVSMIDEMMASSKGISPTLISDLQATVKEMLDAQEGQITQALNSLDLNSNTAILNDLQNTAKELHNLSTSKDLDQIKDTLNSLDSQLKSLGLKNDQFNPDISNSLDAIKNIKDALESFDPQNQDLNSAINDIGKQISSIVSNSQIQSATAPLQSASNQLVNLIKNAPHNLSDDVGGVIDSYSQAMNGVEAMLPPLWFPVTMPTPIVYNDGSGNSFMLAAGSQISPNGNGYSINSPGIMMQSGSTLVNSSQASINIGNGLDQLSFNSLNVNDGSTNTVLTGFNASIDRTTGYSAITADNLHMDMTNGMVDLDNVNMIRNTDGSLQILADSMYYQDGDNSAGLTGFQLGQTNVNGVSTLYGSSDDINAVIDGDIISADNLSFQMVQDSNTGISTGQFSGTNINYQSEQGSLQAASATINVISNPDNSSQIVFNTDSPSWTSDNESVAMQGQTIVSLSQDANGNLTNINAQAENISYSDKAGNILNAQNTDFNIDYNENGSVSNISAASDQIDFTNSSGVVNATGGDLNLAYDENGNLQNIMANAESVNYQGTNGDAFDLTNGQLSMDYHENGQVSGLNGSFEGLNYSGANGDIINATGTDISLNYSEDGLLQSASASVGSVNYQNAQGDKLDITNGAVNLNYYENGNLSGATGSIEQLNYTGANGDIISASGTDIALNYYEDGTLKDAAATVGAVNYQNAQGDKLDITNGSINLEYNENGDISHAIGSFESLDYTGTNGDIIKASGANVELNYGENGLLQNASAAVGSVNYQNANGDKLDITNGAVNLNYYENGNLSGATGSIEQLNYTGANGDIISAAGTDIALNYNEDGLLQNASAAVGSVNYQNANGDKLDITNGAANLNYYENGNLASATGSIEQLDYTGANGDIISATGTEIALNYNEDGIIQSASASVGSVNYQNPKGDKLDITNGNINLNYDDQGNISSAAGSIEQLDWTSSDGNIISASGTNVNLNYGENGLLQNASASVGSVNYQSKEGDIVDLTNGNVSLNYDEQGKLLNAAGSIENLNWTGKDGKTLNVSGIDVSLDVSDPDNTKIGAAFYNLNYQELKDDGSVIINATNGQINIDDQYLKVHLDSAEMIQKLSEEMNVKVENVDLLVEKNEEGGLKQADLQIGQAEAHLKGMDIFVTTDGGDRLRLNMSMSDDGSFIKEAYLQIPEGGEIKVNTEDYNITLGEDQIFKFTQDGEGTYSFRAEGLDINYESVAKEDDKEAKTAKVKVEGGNAEIKFDANTNEIIIEEFSGTRITGEFDGNTFDIDIDKLNGFIVQAGGVDDGTTMGGVIRLKPTDDNSTMTMSVDAKVQGIPVSLKFDDVHDFEASAFVTENMAQVYVGDKSGQGRVELNAGPFKAYGSAVEFVARYHTFDASRLLSAVSTYTSTEGVKLGGGLSFDPDGVLRWGTSKPGPHAEIAVILPDNLDNNYTHSGKSTVNESFGLMTSIGWQFQSKKSGTTVTPKVFGGLMPGSYVSIKQTQGSSSLYGIPLTKNNAIPTTATAGLGMEVKGEKGIFNTTVGAYANAAAFAPEDTPIKEDNMYGGYAGFTYSQEDSQYSLMGTMGMTKDKTLDPGVRFGYSRKFNFSDFKPKQEEQKTEEKKE